MDHPQAGSHTGNPKNGKGDAYNRQLVCDMKTAPNNKSPETPQQDPNNADSPHTPSDVITVAADWLVHYWDIPREKSKWTDIGTLVLTCAIAAAAIYSAWVFQGQLTEARKAVTLTVDSFRMDERAWVEIEPIKPVLFSPANQQFSATYTCNIFPKNVGKTPALDVEARATDVMSVDGWDKTTEGVFKAQDMLYSAMPPEAFHSRIPRVLAPNTVSPVPFRLTCQAPGQHGDIHYLIGKINYCDKFNVKHWLRFCFYVVNARGEIWACKNGNDEDRSDETPTPQTACRAN
jgi:hypothetical protein